MTQWTSRRIRYGLSADIKEKQTKVYDAIVKYRNSEEVAANMHRPPYILELNKRYKELLEKEKERNEENVTEGSSI